uniref:Uncharacterized protein n=1 Tax=Arundo donax TaxID=35708 RepID=A0A0A9AX16_ARUDO
MSSLCYGIIFVQIIVISENWYWWFLICFLCICHKFLWLLFFPTIFIFSQFRRSRPKTFFLSFHFSGKGVTRMWCLPILTTSLVPVSPPADSATVGFACLRKLDTGRFIAFARMICND